MAKAVIGGEKYEIPVLNFKRLKRAYPILEEAQKKVGPVEQMDSAVKFISLALEGSDKPLSIEEMEEKLLAPEMPALGKTMMEVAKESGLMPSEEEVGNEPKKKTKRSSTATSTKS